MLRKTGESGKINAPVKCSGFRWIIPAAAFILLVAAGSLRPQTAPQRSALAWKIERIQMNGSSFPNLKGSPIGGLRLIAFQDGKAAAIPFQIDERDPRGAYVLADPSGKQTSDVDGGKLDDNDELVFMASDTGEKGKVEGAKAVQEIELKNPVDGAAAYAYLAEFAADAPAISKKDYVAYRKTGNREEIVTPSYIQGFNDQHVFFDDLTILPAAGGNGKNFIDKMKMRTEVQAIGGKLKVDRCEEDFRSVVTGIKDGPVRVIRRNDTRMAIMAGVKSPSVVVSAIFQRDTFEVPSIFSLPMRMDLVASDVVYRQGLDLNKSAIGVKYYNNFEKTGVVFDGKMTPAEEKIATSSQTHRWAMITGSIGTFLYVGKWQKNMPIKVLAYYRDDSSTPDPPENVPGQMMYGFRFEDLLKVKGDVYSFNLLNYIVPNYDGDTDSIDGLADRPFEIKVR